MNKKQFNSLVRELFGEVLTPFGFTAELSRNSTFYRQVGDDVFHVITPAQFSGGTSYQVLVFPTSPVIYGPLFSDRFPDSIGDSTGGTYLNEKGVGGQDSFSCKHEQVMREGFLRRMEPALLHHAIPYLDSFRTLEDMLPVISNKLSRGLLLHHLGYPEGRDLIISECERLGLRKKTDDPLAVGMVQHIDALANS